MRRGWPETKKSPSEGGLIDLILSVNSCREPIRRSTGGSYAFLDVDSSFIGTSYPDWGEPRNCKGQKIEATGAHGMKVASLSSETCSFRLGLYGLSLPDLRAAQHLLVDAPLHWLPWRIVRESGVTERADSAITRDCAQLAISPDGSLLIDRASRTSVFTMPYLPSDEEMVHPYIAGTAAIAARWHGWQSFHAGGFAVGGEVWGVVGDRGLGKSTLLAALAGLGAAVVSDDLLVVHEGRVLAGPRCIDLRQQSAAELGVGHHIGVVGNRERWRVQLGTVEPELPLAGWITLAWGSELMIERVTPAERFPRLLDNLTVLLDPPDPPSVLALASLPMWTLRRPRRLDGVRASAERLISHLRPE